MKDVEISKFLSYVLRHQPESIGIALDRDGWVEVTTLLEAAQRHGRRIDRAALERVVAQNDKQRFAFSEDGMRVRASQGHSSASVAMWMEAQMPPAVLYHGTATRFLESILREGLRPGSRHHVHLSADLETATRVGARHGVPVVLTVDAAGMHAAGKAFFFSDNGVWLTAAVPPAFLTAAAKEG